MIRTLRGIIAEGFPGENHYIAVIEVGGIGFELKTSLTTATALPMTGKEIKLYSYLHVREDVLELYGFANEEELSTFSRLISVSGVGPKMALAILSAATPAQLSATVAAGDISVLVRAKGVGTKLAQRIILELKGKLSATSIGAGQTGAAHTVGALDALVSLGYSQSESNEALKAIDAALSVEDQVKAALKILFKTKIM